MHPSAMTRNNRSVRRRRRGSASSPVRGVRRRRGLEPRRGGLRAANTAARDRGVTEVDPPVGGDQPRRRRRALDGGSRRPGRAGAPSARACRCSKCGAVEDARPGPRRRAPAPSAARRRWPRRRPTPELVRPAGVLPFRVPSGTTRSTASAAGSPRSGSGRTISADIAGFDSMRGVYVPFWTFDAAAQSRLDRRGGLPPQAAARTGASSGGRRRAFLEHFFDDLPVPASRGIDAAAGARDRESPTAELVP